jgi:prepilin-type N-terminal cleavage/methylation domain-containing protein
VFAAREAQRAQVSGLREAVKGGGMFCGLRRSRSGFTATELLTVAAIVTSVSTAAYVNVKDRAKETACRNNLRQIGQALLMMEMTHGRLPDAAFFPSKPKKDKDSIVVIMKNCNSKLFVCPSAPEELAKKGLTFIWNDKCSGKASHRIKDAKKTWLMVEVNAVSDKVPAPHPHGYNVLYADLQTIKTVKELPKDLVELVKKMGEKEEAGKGKAEPEKTEEKKPGTKKTEEKKPAEKAGEAGKKKAGEKQARWPAAR